MNTLRILVSQQLDGFNFSLSPSTRRALIADNPGVSPLSLVFVSSENNKNIANVFMGIEKHLLPVLTGLELEELQKNFDMVSFIDTISNTVLFELVFSNVKEEQQRFKQMEKISVPGILI